jgi:hypothetical protein
MTARRKPVTLVWQDSCSQTHGGWQDPKRVGCWLKPTTIHTRGFIVKETKRYLLVAMSLSSSTCSSEVWAIPKFAIIKRRNR